MRIIFIIAFIFLKAEAQDLPAGSQGSALSVADSLFALANYSEAINQYAKDGSLTSKLQIARAYNAIGNYDKSILEYEEVVRKNPTSQSGRFELGKLYFKIGKLDWASGQFLDLLIDRTGNPEYSYYMGRCLYGLGNIKEGVLYYKSAVKMDSTHLRSMFYLGKHYVGIQEKDSALQYVNRGLEFYPNDVSLINLKALALFNNNEYVRALPFFERLVELGEQKEYIYSKLAYCYFKNWEFEKAKTTYTILLAINDRNDDAYFNLAQVYLKNRQLDSAKIYLNKSIEVQEPSFVREYMGLAGIAREEQDFKSAFKYYKLAYAEDKSSEQMFFSVCTAADQLYKDPKLKLQYYENFINKFGTKNKYYAKLAAQRITELKEEIHFAKD